MTHESESTAIGKEPCPACHSRDNLARYSDGHGYCFGCQYYEHGNGERKVTEAKPKAPLALIEGGEIKALTRRGITEETCKKWDYRCGVDRSGQPVQIATYCDPEGNPVAQKLRYSNKAFVCLGKLKEAGLFGQHLWRDGGKMVVVTEGEIDALSVSQLQQNKWPVVSVPAGAAGAAKAIAKSTEWLHKFEKVILMFDDDQPGRDAAVECAELLEPGRAFIARIAGFKDANEALQAGKGPLVIDAIWGAKEYRPDGVTDVASLIDDATKAAGLGIPWPWDALTEVTYGIRSKELYAFGGGTGVGKSDIFKDVALHLIANHNQKVGLIFLEEPPSHTLKMLAGKSVGKRFHVPGVITDPNEVRKAILPLDGKVFFYDHFGAMDYATVKDKIRYMVQHLDCKHIFLDHITALAASMEGDDERKQIDKLMADLSTTVQQLDCTLYFISHLTTPEGKPHEEGGRVLEKHFRGSRSIGYWSHFMFGIERNKQDVDGVTTFRVLKDRYTGDANGLTFGLRYDREKGRAEQCELPEHSGEKYGFSDNSQPSGAF